METLFKEMFNFEIDINVDIVFTIDATESLCPFMEKIKYFILSCGKKLRTVLEDEYHIINQFRIKIIIVRKHDNENKYVLEQSRFFSLPIEHEEFYNFVSKIKAQGIDESQSGLEALSLAMQSDFTKEGIKKRHVIILFTNTSTQMVGQQKDDTHINTHMNLSTLYDLWKNMNDNAKRFVMFAPNTVPWSEIEIDFENTLSMDIATINEDFSLDNTVALSCYL